MDTIKRNVRRSYSVIICAVLFGCDASVVGLKISESFSITRKSLHPRDKFYEIFNLEDMEIRREYECARIDDTLDVACIYKEFNITLEETYAENYYAEMCDKVLKELDNGIRAIRLICEGPLRFRKLIIKMRSEPISINGTNESHSFNSSIPIGEAYDVKTIKKLHCDDLEQLDSKVTNINFPLKKEFLNKAHLLYDRSYLVSLLEAQVLLITCLEVLFLKSDSNKKDLLAKRCATFIFDTKEERIQCYQRLKNEYKVRSDYVHDGKYNIINEDGIVFLRDCARKSIHKLLEIGKEKGVFINELKNEISSIDYYNQN